MSPLRGVSRSGLPEINSLGTIRPLENSSVGFSLPPMEFSQPFGTDSKTVSRSESESAPVPLVARRHVLATGTGLVFFNPLECRGPAMPRRFFVVLLALLTPALVLAPVGCTLPSRRPVSSNPMIVPITDFETVWTATVRALDEYLDGVEENRLAGRIRTEPKIGATLLEPWNGDSVGFNERLESSLQTIRRFATARIEPAPNGGYAVRVEVWKELEDLERPERQSGGQAAFPQDFPINRTREIVGPVPSPLEWIPKGRDNLLEQEILRRIQAELFR